jgi:hypothetical protein
MPEVPLTPAAPETWPCPCCRGLGEVPGGAVEFRTASGGMLVATSYRPAAPCRLCRGKGRVLVSPLPDEGAVS